MNKFLPKEYYENIYKIDYNKLKTQKIKCLLFDLDNTLIPYKEKNPTPELKKLFEQLQNMNFKIIIFTNASSKRIIPFKPLNIDYNCTSLKPLKHNFIKIIKKYNFNINEVCIIGDQLFTDIYGGNRVGIYTILVEPLSKYDLIFTKILRYLETIYLNYHEKKGTLIKRRVR